ncbi:MAG: rhodanese-like domain-containing protein [Pyrinomonadaceae bacterium]
MKHNFQIITFYEFKNLGDAENLQKIKMLLKAAMIENEILGTIILAGEGFNSTISGEAANVEKFIGIFENVLAAKLKYKTSYFSQSPFKRAKVRIKKEIVTLKKQVEIEKAIETHIKPKDWNKIISDPETLVLDTRNEYEVELGTFKNAVNPNVAEFSQMSDFVKENLDSEKHKKVAMFCTGGIRCEKFAPFLKDLGFETVFQLEGGILKYLEEIPEEENLWQGDCFVFDERVSVNRETFHRAENNNNE